MSEKTRQIIKKVAELYSYGNERKTVEEVTQINYEKLLDKESEWEVAFEDYDIDDVLGAINEFWRWKSDKSRPNVSQIISILEGHNIHKKHKVENKYNFICIETALLEKDRALGRHLDKTLIDYRVTVNYILNHLLTEDDYDKNDDPSIEWGNKYQKALSLGLFGQFDSLLESSDELPRCN